MNVDRLRHDCGSIGHTGWSAGLLRKHRNRAQKGHRASGMVAVIRMPHSGETRKGYGKGADAGEV